MSREEVEPDTSVDINFEAKPNSYIGVTGIDQSVLLLKTGNDISHVSQPSILTTDQPPSTVYIYLLYNFIKKIFLLLRYQDNVLDELRTYDNGEHSNYMPYLRESLDRQSMFWWPGSYTAHQAFDVSVIFFFIPIDHTTAIIKIWEWINVV